MHLIYRFIFGTKKVETDIKHAEKFMVSLVENGSLQQVDLDFKVDKKMSDILTIVGYGKIVTVALKTEKNKQAQYMVCPPVRTNTINDIHISSLKELKIRVKIQEVYKQSKFTGYTISPSGKVILIFKGCTSLLLAR